MSKVCRFCLEPPAECVCDDEDEAQGGSDEDGTDQ